MTNRLDDRKMSEGLENLPRHQTSEDFTDKIMSRLEQRRSRRLQMVPGGVWVIATALVLAIGIFVGVKTLNDRRQEIAYQQRVEAIRDQYQQIHSDVNNLRREASQSPAVVYLGGNETFGLVVDLADLKAYEESAQRTQIQTVN